MVRVTETNLLTLPVESTITFMNAEVDVNAESWHFTKKRRIKARKRHGSKSGKPLDLSISFHRTEAKEMVVNEAGIYLYPDELPIFTEALIRHPILFPTNYSQQVSREHGIYCMRIKSLEPFEAFARRLSEALAQLK